ncbi:MAG: ATP-binding protein [Ignavibacteria bacterium]|nr:ATP-binding protein [Ignavibacteria bacterium]
MNITSINEPGIITLIKNNFFILTGAMGAGKSTVLNKIREKGISCIEEPAREILKEQRRINGEGVPEKNPKEFNNLMLQRMIRQYNINSDKNEIIIFDREFLTSSVIMNC